MRIVFVYKGRYYLRDANTIEYLSALSKLYGHKTYLSYDMDIFGITDNVFSFPLLNKIFSNPYRIIKKILKHNPDIVVFLDSFYHRDWNKKIAEELKNIRKLITVLCTYDKFSDNSIYDYLLIGEPEFSFEKFIKEEIFKLKKGAYIFDGLADLDKLPLPDKYIFSPFVNFKDSYMIYTSKGCIYDCSYCQESIYKNIFGNNYFRRRSPENVIYELKKAKEIFNIREVIYKDSVFAQDINWLKRYLNLYKKEINVLYKCFAKAEVFNKEIALLLKETNCYCVEFGVQNFNEKIKQEILRRPEKNSVILNALLICDRFDLKYDIDHLFGIPNESIKDHLYAANIYSGLKCLNRIKCHNLTFYPDAYIYKFAPESVRYNKNYKADFFSHIAGEENMCKINKTFQKYFKLLPLFPKRINFYIIKKGYWKIFYFFPAFLIVFFMIILAIKKKDRRFLIYFKFYPLKILKAIYG